MRVLHEPARTATLDVEYRAKEEDAFQALDKAYPRLTFRERQVLAIVVCGFTVAETGKILGITPKTVENHWLRVRRKLHNARTARIIRWATARGII